jgi:PAS domain S-box-containing protein
MNYITLFQSFTLLINLILLFLILLKFYHTRAGRAYFVISCTMTLWSLADVLAMTAVNPTIASLWEIVGEISAVYLAPALIYFVLVTVDSSILRSWKVKMLMIIPSVLLATLASTTQLFFVNAVKVPWGYSFDHTSLFPILGIYVASCTLIAIGIGLSARHKLDPKQKKQFALFITAFLVPLIGGVATEVIAPILNMQVYPLTTVLSSVTSILIIIGIYKYELLSFSPVFAFEQIFNTLRDAILAVDIQGTITLANEASKSLWNAPAETIIGKQLNSLLVEKDGTEFQNSQIQSKSWKNIALAVKQQDGTLRPVMADGVFVTRGTSRVGIVLVIRDMTEIENLLHHLEEKSKKLEDTVKEVQAMNAMMVGRELKMAELKQRISKFEKLLTDAGIAISN